MFLDQNANGTTIQVVQGAELLVTPKFGALLQIQSFSAKHYNFTPKLGAHSLGHPFGSLNFVYELSYDKMNMFAKKKSSRTNIVKNVV